MKIESTNGAEKSDHDQKKDGEFRCRYCAKKMNPFDFKTFHGICGKCRETVDWKDILDQLKK
jgi:hypothetical protein